MSPAADNSQFSAVVGMDETIDGPPLTAAPLTLLDLARPLLNTTGLTARRQEAVDALASVQQQIKALGDGEGGDTPGEADAAEDARIALEQQSVEWSTTIESLDTELKELQRWEGGFRYLPNLGLAATELFINFSGNTKDDDDDTPAFGFYDPFTAVSRDKRSMFGWPGSSYEERAQRSLMALVNHEAWQCENEFWGGGQVPTNYHLTASSHSPTVGSKRTLVNAWPSPDAAPGTVLGTSVGVTQSLAALDQAIADSDAGTGYIHATPYVVQLWAKQFPYLRNAAGDLLTVNKNLIVPGYGYGGTGPDVASRSVSDGVTTAASAIVTSATAAFVAGDLGQPLLGAGIPIRDSKGRPVVIVSVDSGTQVHLSAPATLSGSSVSITVQGYGGRLTFATKQWAYATDAVFHLQADAHVLPYDFSEESPELTEQNAAAIRAERVHALITNQLLRAAVLVDTTTA